MHLALLAATAMLLSTRINAPLLPHMVALKTQFTSSYKEVFGCARRLLRLSTIIFVCPSVNDFLGHSARRVVARGNKGPFECAGVRQRNRSNTGGEVTMPTLFSLNLHKMGHIQGLSCAKCHNSAPLPNTNLMTKRW